MILLSHTPGAAASIDAVVSELSYHSHESSSSRIFPSSHPNLRTFLIICIPLELDEASSKSGEVKKLATALKDIKLSNQKMKTDYEELTKQLAVKSKAEITRRCYCNNNLFLWDDATEAMLKLSVLSSHVGSCTMDKKSVATYNWKHEIVCIFHYQIYCRTTIQYNRLNCNACRGISMHIHG